MKILQIIQRPQRRGAEIFACQLGVHLLRQGHSTTILFLFGTSNTVLDYPIPFHFLNAKESNGLFDLTGYLKLAKLINAEAYDVVQANAGDTLRYCCISKKLFGWKSLLVFRNASKMSAVLSGNLKKFFYRRLIRELDGVASVSQLSRHDFMHLFDSHNLPIVYLPIGVDAPSIGPYTSWSNAGLPSFAGPVLLHVGSFTPEKNHKGLLEIFEKVCEHYPHASLLLVGQGNDQPWVRELASALPEGQVFFAGSRNDVLSLMPLCSALLLPSLIEGLPGVILEAYLSKIPVVAYDVGGVGEVVKNGETGYLIAKGDQAAFADAVMAVLKCTQPAIIANAYSLVSSSFNNQQIAIQFAAFYHQLLTNKSVTVHD